jgi:hypothetical protein
LLAWEKQSRAVTHRSGWVTEHTERASVLQRSDNTRYGKGDPDWTPGVTCRTTIEQPDGHTNEKKERRWGSGSGVTAATTPDDGDVVLAACTHPFTEGDVTFFRPLDRHTVRALQLFPMHVTADAAFDTCDVSDAAARHGGSRAVPLT